jgi:hypothetical protein
VADFLDAQLDSLSDELIPELTEQHVRQLGMAAHPDLVTRGSYGQEVIKTGSEQTIMEAGRHWLAEAQKAAMRVVGKSLDTGEQADFLRRIAAHPQAARYMVSVDQQQQRKAAALAALPQRRK